jgi:hypothetical protein
VKRTSRVALVGAGLTIVLAITVAAESSSPTTSGDTTIPNPFLTADEVRSRPVIDAPKVTTPPEPTSLPAQRTRAEGKPASRPVIQVPANRNDRSGSALAQLCWQRVELVHALASDMMLSLEVSSPPSRLLEVAAAVRDWEGVYGLPKDVQEFAARLQSDAARFADPASRGAVSAPSAFDMENYPGLKQYLSLAAKEPGCVQP